MAGTQSMRRLRLSRSVGVTQNDLTRGNRSVGDYLKRNFPVRYREFATVQTVSEVRDILARTKTRDQVYSEIAGAPEKIFALLSSSLPDFSKLQNERSWLSK